MKALVLISTLGLTLLANTAVAAVDSQDHSVWRNIEMPTAKVVEQDNNQKWSPTQFSTIKDVNTGAKESKIWRRIRF